ncbi:alpha/beta fold hydrolase [Gordonia zhaorongruii]|uniref:alpha/beta fold hydrolase n=1 Tax=Gordonia zhaorongruii TaxID=2597659 RepID=UPI001051E6AF|nr:alpha/beta hydrolase [Gordonia zhaorongruii]
MPTVIVMPGTGSDADYVHRAFAPAAASIGARIICLEPDANLVESYLTRLDSIASGTDRVLVGGVSIGALTAVRWALESPLAQRCDGVLAALPPWSGDPAGSAAAWSAGTTADSIENQGIERAVATMVGGSPEWLGAELSRSWRRLYPRGLVTQLRAAASTSGPELDDLARLDVPLGIAVAPDDPLHPDDVGRAWATAAPYAVLQETRLTEFGPEEQRLGDSCLRAWQEATRRRNLRSPR